MLAVKKSSDEHDEWKECATVNKRQLDGITPLCLFAEAGRFVSVVSLGFLFSFKSVVVLTHRRGEAWMERWFNTHSI